MIERVDAAKWGETWNGSVEESVADVRRRLQHVETVLASNDWLLGSHFTVVDLNVANVLAWIPTETNMLETLPLLSGWLARCLARKDNMCQDHAREDVRVKSQQFPQLNEQVDLREEELSFAKRGVGGLVPVPARSKL